MALGSRAHTHTYIQESVSNAILGILKLTNEPVEPRPNYTEHHDPLDFSPHWQHTCYENQGNLKTSSSVGKTKRP